MRRHLMAAVAVVALAALASGQLDYRLVRRRGALNDIDPGDAIKRTAQQRIAHHRIEQRGLATPRHANQANDLTGFDGHSDVVQDLLSRARVGEAHTVEDDRGWRKRLVIGGRPQARLVEEPLEDHGEVERGLRLGPSE